MEICKECGHELPLTIFGMCRQCMIENLKYEWKDNDH
jgi:NMD protein affecting ribosome stability and mRNA decay